MASAGLKVRHVVSSFIRYKGDVLLLKRSKKVESYRGLWAVVSGSIEEGEDAVVSAKREIKEEVSLSADDVELVSKGELFGCWLLVVGCCLFVVGCWFNLVVLVLVVLVVGCWLLVVGCWLLVVGCLLLPLFVVCCCFSFVVVVVMRFLCCCLCCSCVLL